MGDKSRIEWTDATWNPVTGCSHVSEGCRHCYAETMAKRLHAMGQPGYTDLPWTAQNAAANVQCHDDRLSIPLNWKKPRMIFVNSMSDLFHPNVPDSFIWQVFAVMAACPNHTFQVLTKRPDRMCDLLGAPDAMLNHDAACDELAARMHWCDVGEWSWPISNVWLGTSVENQKAADERILHLLRVPAAVRFLSCEPLLGPVDLCYPAFSGADSFGSLEGIHWVIVGGESGPGARPMHPDWARSLRDQCNAAGVAFHFKQWGEYAPLAALPKPLDENDAAGRLKFLTWTSLDNRGLPSGRPPRGADDVYRVGKSVAGRMLDGRTWDEFPTMHQPAR